MGLDEPEIRLPASVVYLLRPAWRAYLRELQDRGATTALEALRPFVKRLEHLAEEHERNLRASSASGTDASEPPPERAVSKRGQIVAAEAAERLDVSDRQVRKLCDSGELDGCKIGRSWHIEEASVEAYRRRRNGEVYAEG